MTLLYTVKIDGRTLYFIGSIPPSTYEQVEEISKSISVTNNDYEEFSRIFAKRLKEELYVHVEPVVPTQIFRV